MESNSLTDDGLPNFYKETTNFSRFFGLKTPFKTEKFDIMPLIKKFQKEGLVDEHKTKIIENILNSEKIKVYDLMVHRINIKAVEKDTSLKEVLKLFLKTRFSKILVYEQDIDSVVGVVYFKDLAEVFFDEKAKKKDLKNYIKKPIFVPESVKLKSLFTQMQQEKKDIAVVVDEYGGTSGIVCYKDLVDYLFNGLKKDCYIKDLVLKKIDDSSLILNARACVGDVFSFLKIPKQEQKVNLKTLGDFLISILGRIPEKDEQPVIKYKNFEFKILSLKNNFIEKVFVKII